VLYVVVGWVRPEDTPERLAVIERVNSDEDAAVAAPVPGAVGAP
jgi:hypothetical protein